MKAAGLALCLAAPVALGAAEVPTFSSGVESVYVDAFVTEDGAPVHGLTAANFDVRDNGVRQSVRIVDLDTIALSAVLVFDVSGSVAGRRLEDLRRAARAFAAGLKPTDTTRLLTFAQDLRLQGFVAQDAAGLGRSLDALTAGGGTSLHDGVFVALKLAQGTSVRPLLLVFSDGEDNASWLGGQQVLQVAKDQNALIYAAAIQEPEGSPSRWSRLLESLVEETGGRVVRVQSSADLDAAFASILDELRSRYFLAYEPQGPATTGWHKLEVRVRRHKGKVRARAGYYRDDPSDE
jgi:VWFA-related protein